MNFFIKIKKILLWRHKDSQISSFASKMIWSADRFNKKIKVNEKLRYLEIKNVILKGRTRYIFKGQEVRFNSYFNSNESFAKYQNYFMQEELLGLVRYNPKLQIINSNIDSCEWQLQGAWISLLHASSENWMHFISEILPSFLRLIAILGIKKFGILIDETMPKNGVKLIQSLSINTPIIFVPNNTNISLEKLYILKEKTDRYSAFWPRKNNNVKRLGQFSFDPFALVKARNEILKIYSIKPIKKKKVYIKRKSFFRHAKNQQDIMDVIISSNFEVHTIEPSTSLESQVCLFSEISCLITQAGAVLANMIFMPKGSIVICFVADNKYVNLNYFKEYAEIFKINLIYVKGKVINPDSLDPDKIFSIHHPMNAEFEVNIKLLKNALKKYVQ